VVDDLPTQPPGRPGDDRRARQIRFRRGPKWLVKRRHHGKRRPSLRFHVALFHTERVGDDVALTALGQLQQIRRPFFRARSGNRRQDELRRIARHALNRSGEQVEALLPRVQPSEHQEDRNLRRQLQQLLARTAVQTAADPGVLVGAQGLQHLLPLERFLGQNLLRRSACRRPQRFFAEGRLGFSE
jgi:hypothetical protein